MGRPQTPQAYKVVGTTRARLILRRRRTEASRCNCKVRRRVAPRAAHILPHNSGGGRRSAKKRWRKANNTKALGYLCKALDFELANGHVQGQPPEVCSPCCVLRIPRDSHRESRTAIAYVRVDYHQANLKQMAMREKGLFQMFSGVRSPQHLCKVLK